MLLAEILELNEKVAAAGLQRLEVLTDCMCCQLLYSSIFTELTLTLVIISYVVPFSHYIALSTKGLSLEHPSLKEDSVKQDADTEHGTKHLFFFNLKYFLTTCWTDVFLRLKQLV